MATEKKFEEKVKDVINKTAEVSKDVFTKAGGAVQNFSDRSVLKIEIKQLKSKREKVYTELGKTVSDLLFIEGFSLKDVEKKTLSKEAAEGVQNMKLLQDHIKVYTDQITQKEELLKNSKKK